MAGFFKKFFKDFNENNDRDNFDEYMNTPNPTEDAKRRELIEQRKAERLRKKANEVARQNKNDLFNGSTYISSPESSRKVLEEYKQTRRVERCNEFTPHVETEADEEEYYVDEYEYEDEDEMADRAAYDELIKNVHDVPYTTAKELELIQKYSKSEVFVQPMYADDIRAGLAEVLQGNNEHTFEEWFAIIEMSFEYDYLSKEDYLDLKEFIGLRS